MAAAPQAQPGSILRRLAWFVGLWAAGVAVTALVGLVIRFWLA
ncbi:MAG TPA: DUF2474 domain-containing protein [Xanthobacteraceae bacterium]|nr:DUF2474 domain-containing protein [Xanthobacteraceae bacterium]